MTVRESPKKKNACFFVLGSLHTYLVETSVEKVQYDFFLNYMHKLFMRLLVEEFLFVFF